MTDAHLTSLQPSAASAGPATTEGDATPRRRKGLQIVRFSGLYLTLVLILIYSLWVPDTFLTTTTVKSLLSEYSLVMIATLGVLFTLSVSAYDLTVGAMLGFGSVMTAWLTGTGDASKGMNVLVAVLIVLAVGLLVGVVNGFLVVVVGVDSFIATLGMSAVIGAFTIRISNNTYIADIPQSLRNITDPTPLGIPITAIYAAVLAVVAWYVLEHTPLGRRMHATGADLEAARLAGVATSRLRFGAFLVTAVISTLAGILLTAQFGSAAPTTGPGYLLPIFAAALLGATQIKPGRVNVPGAVLAIVLLAVGIKGLQLGGVDLWITNLFNGAALIVAVAGSELSKRNFNFGFLRRIRR